MSSVGTVLSYPIPAFQNVPISSDYYIPNRFLISAITRGTTTVVTTTVVHNYVIGQEVRLIIPPAYGSRSLNEQKGIVIEIPSTTQVRVTIDSNGADAFIASPTFLPTQDQTPAQILAIGDVNTGAINASGITNNTTYILGSFIDISPN